MNGNSANESQTHLSDWLITLAIVYLNSKVIDCLRLDNVRSHGHCDGEVLVVDQLFNQAFGFDMFLIDLTNLLQIAILFDNNDFSVGFKEFSAMQIFLPTFGLWWVL